MPPRTRAPKAINTRIKVIAKQGLGITRLRDGQSEAIEALLQGRDVLAVMPTGWGKSAVYQVAAAMIPGPTVVVSPLISLQQDQVRALDEAEVGEAAEANSLVSDASLSKAMRDLDRGDLEFLLLAPERLVDADTLDQVRKAQPSLFVVDEAHCISAWGHDFRPHYLLLNSVAHAVGRPPILALTATAAPPVRREIIQRLDMHEPVEVVRGFDRPNITLEVVRCTDNKDKQDRFRRCMSQMSGPGIVYAATRARTEEVAGMISELGLQTVAYHAGLSGRTRRDVQESFMDGSVEVVVATIAFGMGIDKPDVRFVHHYDVPGSPDSYYQEIGRAGRDGEAARAVLFYRPEDLSLKRRFATSSGPARRTLEQVATLLEQRGSLDDGRKHSSAIVALADAGAVELQAGQPARWTGEMTLDEAVDAVRRSVKLRRGWDRSRVEMMRAYAETAGCRRSFLLAYFGERYDPPCGSCDACYEGRERPEPDPRFPVSAQVSHDRWGHGQVVAGEGDAVVVLFDDHGYRTLSADAVSERGLLEVV